MSTESTPAVVQWQYLFITKQTENYLLAEVNAAGAAGWEMVACSYNRDLKGIWGWTAWLKRPASMAAAGDAAAIACGAMMAGTTRPR